MFDSRLRPVIDPPLDRGAAFLARLGVSANAATGAGLVLALAAAGAIVAGAFAAAFVLIVLNRLADGVDGAIARRSGSTDLGGYYDIVFDTVFYGTVPLAFALYDPAANALAAAALIASFYVNGASFLAFAALAARRGLTTAVQGEKRIYYFAGIAEGAETIAVFLAMTAFPGAFAWIACAFAALCGITAAVRVFAVRDVLSR